MSVRPARDELKKRAPRSRTWFGTVWLQEDLDLIQMINSEYCLISDDDHTEDEQLHWHVLLRFNCQRNHPPTKTAHWERPVNIIEAREYCLSKGPNFKETGTLEIADQNKEDWHKFVEMCKVSTPKEMIEGPFSKLYARYRGFAGEVHNQFANLSIMEGELENLWLWGKPRTGKTKYAWEHYPDLFIKPINKWWDGYHGQEAVLLDDWDPRHECLTQHLKTWADRYPFRAETKGSSMMCRPKHIIITSNYSIEECFQNPQDAEAIRSRFKVHHFSRLGYTIE